MHVHIICQEGKGKAKEQNVVAWASGESQVDKKDKQPKNRKRAASRGVRGKENTKKKSTSNGEKLHKARKGKRTTRTTGRSLCTLHTSEKARSIRQAGSQEGATLG